ncbi:MAG: hypothetical protein ACKVXR_12285 [Planctomycetota bacterium]
MTKPVCKPAGRWPIPGPEIPAVALILFGAACSSTPDRRAASARPREERASVVAAEGVQGGESGSVQGESSPGQGESSSIQGESGFPVHGYLTSVYRGRWTSEEGDHDLQEILSLDFGDPLRHAWTGHAMTRVNADLDGREDSPSGFSDLNDLFDGAVTVRLYDAWVERRGDGVVERTRIGRQTLWDTPVFAWFDGVSAQTSETEKSQVSLGVYGGIPVRQFESLRGGDLLLGAYAQGRPWKEGRMRLDWMRLEDESSTGQREENLTKLGLWQGLWQRMQLEGSASMLGSEERDFSTAATWRNPGAGLTLHASYYQLLETQRDLPLELDPFYATLTELFPYGQARVLASKDFGEKVSVEAGADVRRVADEGDEGQFNREFERFFSTVHLRELLPASLALGLTGEIWESDGSDIRTWGVDLSRRFGEKFESSLGSAYALYKVDVQSGEERDDVRTWYLRLRWKRSSSIRWDLRYEVEDSDIDTFHGLRVAITWRF